MKTLLHVAAAHYAENTLVLNATGQTQGQKLSGRDRYRIRQGSYRIVYSIEDDRLIVYVVKVGHRSDVYREPL